MSNFAAILFFTFLLWAVKIYLHANFRALFFWLWVVKIYFHAKFWASSLKIERFGGHFVFWRPFCFWWPFCFSLFGCERSRSTSMRNFGLLAQKMAILENDPPLTPLTSLYLSAYVSVITMQNFELLAQKLTKLWLF